MITLFLLAGSDLELYPRVHLSHDPSSYPLPLLSPRPAMFTQISSPPQTPLQSPRPQDVPKAETTVVKWAAIVDFIWPDCFKRTSNVPVGLAGEASPKGSPKGSPRGLGFCELVSSDKKRKFEPGNVTETMWASIKNGAYEDFKESLRRGADIRAKIQLDLGTFLGFSNSVDLINLWHYLVLNYRNTEFFSALSKRSGSLEFINEPTEEYHLTPFHLSLYCAKHKETDSSVLTQFFIEHGGITYHGPDVPPFLYPPIIDAINFGLDKTVALTFQKQAADGQLFFEINCGPSALCLAAIRGNLKYVEQFLRIMPYEDRYRILSEFYRLKKNKCCVFLGDCKSHNCTMSINYGVLAQQLANSKLLFPLHLAASFNDVNLTRELLRSGASFTLRDNSNKLPIYYAYMGEYFDIVNLYNRIYLDMSASETLKEPVLKEWICWLNDHNPPADPVFKESKKIELLEYQNWLYLFYNFVLSEYGMHYKNFLGKVFNDRRATERDLKNVEEIIRNGHYI